MKRRIGNKAIIAMVVAVCMLMAGCAEKTATSGTSNTNGTSVIALSTNTSGESAADSDLFTDRDLEQTADTEDAQYITLSDNSTVSITEAGVYVISGSASECTIKIEADEADKVQLVLDGAEITNSDFPAIYVVSADKVFITTTDSVNTLSVTDSFTADGDTNTDAVIFSKQDIVFNGVGTLNIYSACGNGISGKDEVKFTGGSYSITSAKDSIEANDAILICGGSFTISSQKDGMHSENDEDNTLGYIYISGGTFDITAASDGIQGTSFVQIDGGDFTISSSEGIEATFVQINDGTINITATDDGINATSKSNAYSVAIEFNGGYTTISMGQGDTDAIDANGSIYVNGGTIDVTAPTSSFDYDQTAEFNGGTIIINGEEVSEIPEDMMGGGFGGGMGGMNGDMGGGMGGGRQRMSRSM